MATEAGLLGFALLLAVAAPRVLARRPLARTRTPRLAVAAWQASSVSLLLSVLAAGLLAVLPWLRMDQGLGRFLRACALLLHAQYRLPGGALVAALAAVATAAVLARTCWCLTSELHRAASGRAVHRDALRLIGRTDDGLGAVLVDHSTPQAYCLPGRRGRVVLTTAAVRDLEPDELDAVLAHERAHLTGRHHLVLAVANTLARAFPFVPLFRAARTSTAVLVEMLADDQAARGGARLSVASALLTLGSSRPPVVALGATGTATALRVERLLVPAAVRSRLAGLALSLGLTALVATPVVLAALPAVAIAGSDYCPV